MIVLSYSTPVVFLNQGNITLLLVSPLPVCGLDVLCLGEIFWSINSILLQGSKKSYTASPRITAPGLTTARPSFSGLTYSEGLLLDQLTVFSMPYELQEKHTLVSLQAAASKMSRMEEMLEKVVPLSLGQCH